MILAEGSTVMAADDLDSAGTDTIILIHGLWVTALSWERWVRRYQARGYRVLAPDWPGMGDTMTEPRRAPPEFANLGVIEIADHYDRLIHDLGRAPVIIGHCVGGLVVQLLLDRGLGAAGVAIGGAPAKGTMSWPFPTLRFAFLGLRNRHAISLTPRQFRRAVTSTLSPPEAMAVRERYHVPGPGRAIRQVGFANFTPRAATRVDFGRTQRAPLLLIAGGQDRIFPAAVTRSSLERYRQSAAVTDYKEFPDRSHYTIGEPGWEKVADYALRWAMEHVHAGSPPPLSGTGDGARPRNPSPLARQARLPTEPVDQTWSSDRSGGPAPSVIITAG
jgi:alpha-beta hydrolase superfamily lysophospholipase